MKLRRASLADKPKQPSPTALFPSLTTDIPSEKKLIFTFYVSTSRSSKTVFKQLRFGLLKMDVENVISPCVMNVFLVCLTETQICNKATLGVLIAEGIEKSTRVHSSIENEKLEPQAIPQPTQ